MRCAGRRYSRCAICPSAYSKSEMGAMPATNRGYSQIAAFISLKPSRKPLLANTSRVIYSMPLNFENTQSQLDFRKFAMYHCLNAFNFLSNNME